MKITSLLLRVMGVVSIGSFLILMVGVSTFTKAGFITQYAFLHTVPKTVKSHINDKFYNSLAQMAESRLKARVLYNSAYRKIPYPMGDVPSEMGVCTDVVIRSYRLIGIDLQKRVHEDMKRNFLSYPKMWGLISTDTNIDHRRVPNLMTFFNRSGSGLPITMNQADYLPGHIVAWNLGEGVMHIGIVSSKISKITKNPLIVHNIGAGPKLDDMLFDYKIIGHYRYGAENN